MFEFFFFDGEEISNFFSDSAYNTYVKNAVLTLCGYDTFSLIKKFCDSYVSKESLNSEYDSLLEQLSAKEAEMENLDAGISSIENTLQELEEKKVTADDEKNNLEAQFRKAGGLNKSERDRINDQIRQYDRIKNECSKRIRDYIEGIMPFYITYDLSQDLGEQLLQEDHMRQYLTSTQQLSVSMLQNTLSASGAVPPDQVEKLSRFLHETIASALCPVADPNSFLFPRNRDRPMSSG